MLYFAYSLAKSLKKTVKEMTESMDAHEFVNWMAYNVLQDDKEKEKIQAKIVEDQTLEESATQLRGFFNQIAKSKKK